MKLRIEIDLSNAAFDDIMETTRILGEIGVHVGSNKDVEASGVCFDINGNRVGCWEIVDEQDLNLKIRKRPQK